MLGRVSSTPSQESLAGISESSPEEFAPRQIRKGSIVERDTYVAALRDATQERHARRYRLAGELAVEARTVIPHERGLATVPPGTIAAAAVVRAANGLIDEIGHDRLMAKDPKGGFMVRNLLPLDVLTADSPYMRMALSHEVVAPVATYLGFVPVLNGIDILYSAPSSAHAPTSSQLWHLDVADTTQVKVWVHCTDVGPQSGPLTAIEAGASKRLAERIEYRFSASRVPDETVVEILGPDCMTPLEGPISTVDFIDTSRCFHFGSRVPPDAPPRRMVVFQFLTPYAFAFGSDHRTKVPFTHLASEAATELERLVLGTD
jgi:hypothetical protein